MFAKYLRIHFASEVLTWLLQFIKRIIRAGADNPIRAMDTLIRTSGRTITQNENRCAALNYLQAMRSGNDPGESSGRWVMED